MLIEKYSSKDYAARYYSSANKGYMAGPVMIDLLGTQLSASEIELLKHPLVGGIILFARNCVSPEQVMQLCAAVRTQRADILIAVDQEGGRVQRLKQGFLSLPSLGQIGANYLSDHEAALAWAYHTGWLMAAEVLSVG